MRHSDDGIIIFHLYEGQVDHSVFSSGFEHMDGGYSTYIAFLLNDHEVSHPVLLAFCRELLMPLYSGGTGMGKGCFDGPGSYDSDGSDDGYANSSGTGAGDAQPMQDLGQEKSLASILRKKRARTRWFLAITLARNRQLIRLRKNHLCKKVKKAGLASKAFSTIGRGIKRAGISAATKLRSRQSINAAGSDYNDDDDVLINYLPRMHHARYCNDDQAA